MSDYSGFARGRGSFNNDGGGGGGNFRGGFGRGGFTGDQNADFGGFSRGGFGRGGAQNNQGGESVGFSRGGFGRGGSSTNQGEEPSSGSFRGGFAGNQNADSRGFSRGGFGRGGGESGGFSRGGFGRGGSSTNQGEESNGGSFRGGFTGNQNGDSRGFSRGGFGRSGAQSNQDDESGKFSRGGFRGGSSTNQGEDFGGGGSTREGFAGNRNADSGGFSRGGFGRGGAQNNQSGESGGFSRGGFGFGRGGSSTNQGEEPSSGSFPGGFAGNQNADSGGFSRGGFGRGESGGFSRGGFGRGGSSTNQGEESGGGSFRGGFAGNQDKIQSVTTNRVDADFGCTSNIFTDENRLPPSNYVPEKREIEDLYKEDLDNAENYRQIADDDEEITVSGLNLDKCVLGSWKDANFEPKLYENIVERSKYLHPRKIQAYVIPLAMEGRDIKGHAETGSGKTAAFMLPIINTIMKIDRSEQSVMDKPSPYAIIIEPTRELCNQVYEQGRKFAYETGVSVCKAYGQYSVRENLRELQMGCDILCGTTGRLKHFIFSNQVLLKNLKFLIFDEADVLLDSDFLEDVRNLLKNADFPPKEERQTMLFSATFPDLIQRLSAEVLKAENVMISNQKLVASNAKILQNFVKVVKEDKKEKLLELFKKEIEDSDDSTLRRTLVFVRTKRDADLISLFLCGKDIKATTINGDRPQELREKALRDLRNKDVSVLVSTDVCARGIDIKDLDHVINLDLPNDEVTYVHRIGRTGRLKQGVATSFYDEFDPNDSTLVKKLVKIVEESGQTPPEWMVKAAEEGTHYSFANDGAEAGYSFASAPAPAPADNDDW